MSRRQFFKWSAGALLASGGAVGGSTHYAKSIEPTRLVIERITIPIPGWPRALDGLTVAHLSDFHLFPYTTVAHVTNAIEKTNALHPDLVVLTGDYVLEKAEDVNELAPLLANLEAPYGVFACLGNHDLWTDRRVVSEGVQTAGVQLLVNQGATTADGHLYIAGVDDCWSGSPNLNAALAHWQEGQPVLLLAHEPDFADAFARDGRISLQLSGHTHGGQVRIPGVGAPILPPYGKKYDMGLYWVDGMALYTSRGIGTIGPAVRVNCPPEISLLTLHAPTTKNS